jgi:acyl-CoA synthetase (AMP-forming)/AMP-acid ligase II
MGYSHESIDIHLDQPFPISNRNSAEAVCHILRTVSSHRCIVTAASLGPLLGEVQSSFDQEQYTLSIEELPAFTDIYPFLSRETVADPFEPLSRTPTRDTYAEGVVHYLHSSGSTGFPKSIPYRWNYINRIAHAGIFPSLFQLGSLILTTSYVSQKFTKKYELYNPPCYWPQRRYQPSTPWASTGISLHLSSQPVRT